MDTIKENQLNIKIWRLILAILLVNASGLYLKYFNLSTYIILFGFRFHMSFVLPLIIVFNSNFLPYIKRSFLKPEWRKAPFYLFLILLPLLIETGGLYIIHKIDIGDPEYFYEFGISSIADYPVYLIWNFPQMILLYFFLAFFGLAFYCLAFYLCFVFCFCFCFLSPCKSHSYSRRAFHESCPIFEERTREY